MFVESVPPAMVAEVFEVAGADDDVIVSSMPPPPERPHPRPARPLSMPPAPHPPRPSVRPTAAVPADADALELAPEDLEPVEASNESTETRAALLTPLPTEASVRPGRPRAAQRAWFFVGGVALVLGVALGVRLRAAERPSAAHESALVRPRATAAHVDVSAPNTPSGAETARGVASASETAPNTPAVDATTKLTETLPSSVETEPNAPGREEASLVSSPVSTAPATPEITASAPEPASTSPSHVHAPELAPAPDGTPFDTQAASAAITAAFERAAACRAPNDPSGTVTATLTYAPSGRVTTATVSGAFAGTPIGGCVASALRGARVPPFSGERLTVRRTAELR